ncbi:hypothetical protein HPB51_023059 [Rhipicephalus microplus]|uniref:Uncharacterized protein n=1 Tax=Rhipicephalus microplus TaxID=6941 RepID=A0A9J6F7T3_RHIMP|nr:hypothetical protein HPB51_023059 [Rhipicephalus microplus]
MVAQTGPCCLTIQKSIVYPPRVAVRQPVVNLKRHYHGPVVKMTKAYEAGSTALQSTTVDCRDGVTYARSKQACKLLRYRHVADLTTVYSYRPPRSSVRKHHVKKAPASASETAPGSASGSSTKRVRPTTRASWDGGPITALECYADDSAAEITNQSAGRSQNEATLAFLEARFDQDAEMRLLSYQIDKRKLDLRIQQYEDNMKLLDQQPADDIRLREAEMDMRRMETMAVLEEKWTSAAYRASQLDNCRQLVVPAQPSFRFTILVTMLSFFPGALLQGAAMLLRELRQRLRSAGNERQQKQRLLHISDGQRALVLAFIEVHPQLAAKAIELEHSFTVADRRWL